MDRKKLMQRLERLEPTNWFIEDLAESYIEVYGSQGIEEVIRESGIEHVKGILSNPNTADSIKESIKEYFANIVRESRV